MRAVLALLALPLLLALVLTGALGVFGANWARGPIAHWAQLQTGRPLQIQGDLHLGLGWPLLRLQAQGLRFANPGWAQAPQGLAADHADVQLDLRALLHGRLLLPTVALERPVLMLETAADGRKSWLLDRSQRDERTAVQIGLLTLQQGRIGYDDTGQQTHIRLTVATAGERTDLPRPGPTSGLGAPTDVLFSASGMLRGQALQASGRGASVLGLRDETVPYPLMLEGSIGPTRLRADGRITGMARLAAVDLQVAVRGGSLAQLQPLLGLGLPATPAYAITGHLLRQGDRWQSQGFSGQLGRSDLAGNLQLVLGGVRPLLRGDIASRLLDLGELLPEMARATSAPAPAGAAGRLLPDLPLRSDGWRRADADLQLRVQHVLRAPALPVDGGSARLRLQDAVLTLDALDIGLAGGRLSGSLVLDGRAQAVLADARLQARGLQLAQLLPVADAARNNSIRLHGRIDLRGQGRSVRSLLASADGTLQLAAGPGRISRLLMAQMGLHLLETLQLGFTGDQPVALRCAVADFSVHQGVMTARHLALDTAVSSVAGSGSIDLNQERLDLTLVSRTRNTSLVALRGPIRLHGTLAAPQVQLDTPGIVARGAGAIALGLVNPLLALLPLVEPARNLPSQCARVVAEAGLGGAAVAPSTPAPSPAPVPAPAPPAAPASRARAAAGA